MPAEDTARSAFLSRQKLIDLAWAAPLVAWYGRNGLRASRGLLAAVGALRPGAGAGVVIQTFARLSGVAFCGFLVAVLIVRMPPKSTSAGWAPRLTAVLGTFIITSFELLPPARMSAASAALSSLLILVGFVLSLVTLAWLGRSFSIVPEARGLATTGPYAVSRHLLYVVEQVAMVGYAMQRAGALPWVLLAVEMLLQGVRIRFEEDVLRQAFRQDFDAYSRRTALLIPGLPDFPLLTGAATRG